MFKKRIIMAVLPAVFIWGCSHKNKSMEELKKEIESRLEIINAHFGIALKDPQTGDTVYINAKQSFHAASTMKTPVLAELFKQADSGKFSMDDSITIRNSFRSIVDSSDFSLDPNDDSELELYTRLGEKETIAKLAYEMI
ncbi:MAG TPA: serine hydrolase, partial [Chitinophagaceae bacterium]|nr:serine hydrolase [Chitinophagaceae bacterium]